MAEYVLVGGAWLGDCSRYRRWWLGIFVSTFARRRIALPVNTPYPPAPGLFIRVL